MANVKQRAFRRALEDRLRSLAEVADIAAVAIAALGIELEASSCFYAELTETGAVLDSGHKWTQAGIEEIADLPSAVFASLDELCAGDVISTDGHARVGRAGALLLVPVIRRGMLVAVLALHRQLSQLWSDIDAALAADVADRVQDALERTRAEATLRGNEARQRFLLELGDRTRALSNPEAVIAETGRSLGEWLGATRVAYAEIDIAVGLARMLNDWTDGSAVDMPAVVRLADFGEQIIGCLMAGQTLRIDDAAHHPVTASVWPTLDAIAARAIISVPLLKGGFLVANLNVHQDGRRAWTDSEVSLIEAVAERTWEALERVRTENRLRESEARLRRSQEVGGVGSYEWDLSTGQGYQSEDMLHMCGLQRGGKYTLRDILAPVLPEDLPRVQETISAISRGTTRLVTTYRIRRPADGALRWICDTGQVERDHDGQPRRWVGIIQDVTEQTEAANRVRQSEAELRLITDAIPVLISYIDREGRYRFSNKAYENWFGMAPSTVIGQHMRDILGDEAFEVLRPRVEAAQAGEPISFSAAVPYRSGGMRHVDARYLPRLSDNGEPDGFYALIFDVSERYEADQRLRLAHETAEREAAERTAILAQLAEGVIVADAAGQITFVNEAAAQLHGIAVLGVGVGEYTSRYQLFTEAGKPYPERDLPLARAVTDGVTVEDARWIIRRPDGSELLAIGSARPVMLADGIQIGAVLTVRDDTARRRAEAELIRLNETLERRVIEQAEERGRLWDVSPDCLAVIDIERGTFDRLNPAWTAALGWSQSEMQGQPVDKYLHADDGSMSLALRSAVASSDAVLRFKNRFASRDGALRWLSWVAVPHGGKLYVTVRDVTNEEARQVELAIAQEALRHSQKMEAMGQLTGGVAHDFNNLLTPIMGTLDRLQRRDSGDERDKRLIAGALQSADRAKTLVQRLLAFARRQPLQAVSVDVSTLVSGMAELISSTTGPRIKVVVDAPENLPTGRADPNQLEMAVLNLAVNARDAMPDGGTLRITVNVADVDRHHKTSLQQGSYLQLSVADTGVGMDDATLARAVEPFFSTKGVGKGTGLGLSMVHGLAQQLGGALTIESVVGSGTTVEFWLPLGGPEKIDAPPPSSTTSQVNRCVTALLVDDEELVRISTADMLTELGYEVVEAASAEQALRVLEDGLNPELVVTDHLMPGMSGTELARRLQSERLGLKILVISGYAETAGLAPDLPRLNKPFRKADLANSLAAMV